MLTNFSSQKQKFFNERAQAIVEFAVVLPVLLLLLVGILEVSRMAFYYAAVNNASREAVRYASAVGFDDSGSYTKYNYCSGIKDMAKRSAFFVPLTLNIIDPNLPPPNSVTITYDNPDNLGFSAWCNETSGDDPNVDVSSGDRATVTVTATYSPMVNLIPISSRTFTSTSSRTILGILELSYP